MSTAAYESKPAELNTIEQRSSAYIMPRLEPLDLVVWYGNADPATGPTLAVVLQVHARSARLMTLGPDNFGWAKETSVRHVSDPELQLRPGLKMNDGGWDYLPQTKRLEERLTALEELITSGKAGKKG